MWYNMQQTMLNSIIEVLIGQYSTHMCHVISQRNVCRATYFHHSAAPQVYMSKTIS